MLYMLELFKWLYDVYNINYALSTFLGIYISNLIQVWFYVKLWINYMFYILHNILYGLLWYDDILKLAMLSVLCPFLNYRNLILKSKFKEKWNIFIILQNCVCLVLPNVYLAEISQMDNKSSRVTHMNVASNFWRPAESPVNRAANRAASRPKFKIWWFGQLDDDPILKTKVFKWLHELQQIHAKVIL